MTHYIVVAAETAIDLSRKVEAYVKEGWRPQGGISYDTNRNEFLQAMIK